MSIRNSKVDHRSRRTSVLELRRAGVRYMRRSFPRLRKTGFWALREISLRLHAGDTLGVIGRNGAGKSTLLQLLAGILAPDEGQVVSYGYKASLLSLKVGFIPHLSGRDNIVVSGLLLGLPLDCIRKKAPDIIAFSEIEEFIDEPITTYSSGMRARLGFSIAFHANPDILLIDEVLGVGDAAFVQKSKKVMREKIQSDKTVVLVSHSASSIRSLCNRVIWIDRGHLRQEGPADEVVESYLKATKQAKPSARRRVGNQAKASSA